MKNWLVICLKQLKRIIKSFEKSDLRSDYCPYMLKFLLIY